MTGTAPSRTAAAAKPEPARVREWQAPFLVDVRVTLSVHGRGRGDPTFRIDEAGAIWRTSLTPDGPGTIRVTAPCPAAWRPRGPLVRAQAWGPGADWLLDALPGALGLHDDISGFDPSGHPVLRQVARRYPGLRLGRSGRVIEALVPAMLEQKVVGIEAHRAWRILLRQVRRPAPGPAPGGHAGLSRPADVAAHPVLGVAPGRRGGRPRPDHHQGGAVAGSLEEMLAMTHEDADRRLRTLPGIGPWTSAEVRQRACGRRGRGLRRRLPPAGRRRLGAGRAGRSTTTEMLELLGPYAGHRYRVDQAGRAERPWRPAAPGPRSCRSATTALLTFPPTGLDRQEAAGPHRLVP